MNELFQIPSWRANPEFNSAWIALSKEGKCDSIGGAEYFRVLKEIRTGSASVKDYGSIDKLIYARANAKPA